MNLLILGGTVFLGRHLVDAALAAGHQVTLFNRGQHGAELFPQVERLRGDRDGGLAALAGRRWDAVIDTCGYVPRLVRASAELLAGSVAHYTFVSSISVYRDLDQAPVDENSPVGVLADESVEEITGETYGPLKALCEHAAEAAMPGRVLHVRPGLIAGPHDPTDRFTYWVWRVAQGGAVLAPGRPQRRVELIDGRDLADWILRMVEARRIGVFNATGPEHELLMGDMLAACRLAIGSDARFIWVDEAFLLANGVTPWSELPLWLPEADNAVMAADCRRALAAGLAFRPLTETVQDTLAWLRAGRASADGDLRQIQLRAGMTLAREGELLSAWQTQSGNLP
ncbi:MAG TPA: SDR family oxidoreductase [Anaerolineae bacterium]|nr:SDR family oxidoreductase [Anaerolineae bacterium]